ncbi:GNAT family N-acetyltransferase [Streptomyces sp. NPDC026672]|uniref:GNAT family N-acetyltransferase n=1 Tax=unclassified Streptomyces TaxID=2593676 RepID=UPI0033DCD430
MDLRTSPTPGLTPSELRSVRALLDAAFEGDFTESDWHHCLGGLHALVHDGTGLVAHGSVVPRWARHAGRWLRVGYVEAVAVRADARRAGLGGRIMAALEAVIDRAHDLGALSASEDGAPLYAARGWEVWPGRILALSPAGPVRLTDEEGTLRVRPALAGPLSPEAGLVFDWRDGDVL